MADDAPTQDLSTESQRDEDAPASGGEPQPEKLRVHSLARVLGTTSKRVLDALAAFDGRPRSAHSSVDNVEAERVREALAAGAEEPTGPEESRRRACRWRRAGIATDPRDAEREPAASRLPAALRGAAADRVPTPSRRRRRGRRRHRTDTDDDGADSDDDQSERPGRRRRRGRRGRGRGRGEQNGDDQDGDSDGQTDDPSSERDSADESDESDDDSGDEDGSGANRRRRRRRRRKSASGDDNENGTAPDDPPNTVVHERAPRSGKSRTSPQGTKTTARFRASAGRPGSKPSGNVVAMAVMPAGAVRPS